MPELEKNRPEDEARQAALARLRASLARLADRPGRQPTAVPGLTLTRWEQAGQTDTCFYAPAIGLIVQGYKESLLGSETFRYGELDSLVNGVDMPSLSRILEASPARPLLAVSLNIDRALATELAAEISGGQVAETSQVQAEAGPGENRAGAPCLGGSVDRVAPDVLDAFVRLVDLLDRPEQLPLRAPLLTREIISRVLLGPQGAALRLIFKRGSHSHQIGEAITRLRTAYRQNLRIEELAAQVGMAASTFHRQFKKVTSISPLQYQKCLRLYEAQRLMLGEDLDAGSASRAVGYESSQQFNREYKRLFGEPPHRNIKRLRHE